MNTSAPHSFTRARSSYGSRVGGEMTSRMGVWSRDRGTVTSLSSGVMKPATLRLSPTFTHTTSSSRTDTQTAVVPLLDYASTTEMEHTSSIPPVNFWSWSSQLHASRLLDKYEPISSLESTTPRDTISFIY